MLEVECLKWWSLFRTIVCIYTRIGGYLGSTLLACRAMARPNKTGECEKEFPVELNYTLYKWPNLTSSYGRWSSFRASTSFRVFAAYLTISQPI